MRLRIALATIVLASLTACTAQAVQGAVPACPEGRETSDELVLEAQSVPTAELVPCITSLPTTWSVAEFSVRDGRTTIALRSNSESGGLVAVMLEESCDTTGATEELSEEEGTRLFVLLEPIDDALVGRQFYVFEGGCVTYDFDLRGTGRGLLYAEALAAVALTGRDLIEEDLKRQSDFDL